MRPTLLLDRDGTLNVDRGWVHRPDDFCWIEGAREAITWANDRGILVLHAFTAWIDRELAACGAHASIGPTTLSAPPH